MPVRLMADHQGPMSTTARCSTEPLDEFYRVAFRKKIYHAIDELQADLDAWVAEYNHHRPHQGRGAMTRPRCRP